MLIKLTKNDYNWLEKNYPELNFIKSKEIIEGWISFSAEHEGIKIKDSYKIEIKLEEKKNSIQPQVRELSGKLEKIAIKLNEPLKDQHVNGDGTLCPCISELEKNYLPNGFKIDDFFKNILIPYFYWVSYKSKFKTPPWGEYAHDDLAYLELFAENKIGIERLKEIYSEKELKKISRLRENDYCLCESKKKIKNCHELIYKAIYKLKGKLK